MNTVDVLREAKAILSDPARWLKGTYCCDAEGEEDCNPGDPQAARWCAEGAIARAAGVTWGKVGRHPAVKALEAVLPNDGYVPAFNDTATHPEVIDLFDRAILSLAGEGIASESRPGETAIELAPEGPAPAKDSLQVPDAPSPAGVVA